ncbi:MAG TPA: nitrate- and nitrite sensing domain-containing protein [Streptosporangiaceae bacterium]|nr:nitrate- and nitrite sensing domain-containing protein [Streptosporangiaceae bacterium]
MGLRHRSIRLRVGLLIAVPILCLLALYAFVLSLTLGSAVSEQHASTLRNSIANPVTAFQTQIAQERAFALLSLADPTNTAVAAGLGQQESGTQKALSNLTLALRSPVVTSYAAKPEQAAIANLIAASRSLTGIRGDVADGAISLRTALADYDAIINAGYPVLVDAVDQQTPVSLVTQALGLIDLNRAAQATQAEWDLLSADIAQRRFPTPDRLVFAALANQRQTLVSNAVPTLDSQYRAMLATSLPPATANGMTAIEAAVTGTPWRHGAPPVALAGSKMTFLDYSSGLGKALNEAAAVLQTQAQHNANTQVLELILAAGLGLVGTIVSIVLSLVIGRDLVGQLRELRESALRLARERLPDVIGRLRAGESVDISDYAPTEVSSTSEIDQVQHAFNLVQQSAVQSAVDEARLRRGVSDVFRNLAGRSQSLLHRQLTLLDGMERRATEPDELEDLFRIDHLTTRMRRHAEGLIILSGEAPARGWRQPVPLVDVLRAAVAEVEDYTRIRVLCRTNGAVAGHAVADIIHLIAELAENATVFSPPNTPVRIQGEVVGRGFAVEIEDRGLGISAARLEEINANLANPPQFDLSGSDRLGLFIAGQLAQRHDIKITLRPSVYGGTTAIVLIPTALVVDEDALGREPGLSSSHDDLAPGEGLSGRHAALGYGAGRAAAALAGTGLAGSSIEGTVVAGPAGSSALSGNGHLALELAAERLAAERLAAADLASSELAGQGMAGYGIAGAEAGPAHTSLAGTGQDDDALVGRTLGARGFARPESDQDGADYIGRGFSLGGRTTPSTGLPRRGGAEQTEPARAAIDEDESQISTPAVTELGLPVRIRQASLAPQLRQSPDTAGTQTGFAGGFSIPGALAPGATGPDVTGAGSHGPSVTGSAAVPPAIPASGPTGTGPAPSPIPPTPEAARDTMSALQRGWQLGRSEADEGTEASISVFTPRKSPSGQAFDPHDPDAEATDAEPGDSGDDRGGE